MEQISYNRRLEKIIQILGTASLLLNSVSRDSSKQPEFLAKLKGIEGRLTDIEAAIEDAIACANAIDCVVNSLDQESLDRPIGHFKMKF
jgi:ABC-type transporter Mla subunit MlaD